MKQSKFKYTAGTKFKYYVRYYVQKFRGQTNLEAYKFFDGKCSS